MDAMDILRQPGLWPMLMQTLRNQTVVIRQHDPLNLFPVDPESDSLALLVGKPTRAELEQQIEDMKREVQFWKQMVDDVAEDYERELEKAERGSEIDTEAVADAIADILAGYYRAL